MMNVRSKSTRFCDRGYCSSEISFYLFLLVLLYCCCPTLLIVEPVRAQDILTESSYTISSIKSTIVMSSNSCSLDVTEVAEYLFQGTSSVIIRPLADNFVFAGGLKIENLSVSSNDTQITKATAETRSFSGIDITVQFVQVLNERITFTFNYKITGLLTSARAFTKAMNSLTFSYRFGGFIDQVETTVLFPNTHIQRILSDITVDASHPSLLVEKNVTVASAYLISRNISKSTEYVLTFRFPLEIKSCTLAILANKRALIITICVVLGFILLSVLSIVLSVCVIVKCCVLRHNKQVQPIIKSNKSVANSLPVFERQRSSRTIMRVNSRQSLNSANVHYMSRSNSRASIPTLNQSRSLKNIYRSSSVSPDMIRAGY